MNEIERAIDSLDGWLRGQHVDMGRAHAALLVLAAEVSAATARAEAAEADRTTLRTQRDQWKNNAYAAYARLCAGERERDEYRAKFQEVEDLLRQHRRWLMDATARAQAAEARALAATQQWSVARAQLESVHDYAIYYRDAWEEWQSSDAPAPLEFAAWLAQQSEVQP